MLKPSEDKTKSRKIVNRQERGYQSDDAELVEIVNPPKQGYDAGCQCDEGEGWGDSIVYVLFDLGIQGKPRRSLRPEEPSEDCHPYTVNSRQHKECND